MRQAGLGAAAPAPPPPPLGGWQQAMDWWSQLLPKGPSQANDALGRFNQQARDWYGQMQQVAAQFAGRDSSAADVTQAWRQALGASGANPFPEMFKSMSGKGLHGLDDWIEQAKPFLDSIQRDNQRWLHMPAFGQHREHQERLQGLVQSQLDYQQRSQAFNTLMATCAQRAFEVFEKKLAAREEPGRQITSARGLFDLWIDAAEEAYAEIALSAEFRQVSGALTNAQMRLRAGLQKEVELLGAQFGMPTRTEVDSAHRKIAELERSLRRAAAAAERSGSSSRSRSPPAKERTGAVAETDAPAKAARKRRKPRKSAASKTVAGKTARGGGARKAAAKKAAPRKAAARKRAPAPAAVEAKRVPVARATKSRTASTRAKSGATAPAVRKSAPRKAAGKKTAARGRTSASTAASAKSGSGKSSTSMKDWVARNKAAADSGAGVAQKRTSTGKKGARK